MYVYSNCVPDTEGSHLLEDLCLTDRFGSYADWLAVCDVYTAGCSVSFQSFLTFARTQGAESRS